MRKYKFAGDLAAADAFDAAYSDFTDGKLLPDLKSQEIPTDNDGPVTIVVGNFDDVVINSGKDVFIESTPLVRPLQTFGTSLGRIGRGFARRGYSHQKEDATNEHEKVDVVAFQRLNCINLGV